MPNPHGDFIWYELITPDPDGAKSFYDAVMGWDVARPASDQIDYREIRTGDGAAGGMLRLTAEMQSNGAPPTWLGYVGVDNVDQAVAAIEQAGGKAMMPAFEVPNVGRIAMVADPQGVPFYVMRGDSDETSHAFSPTGVGHCGWNELATRDQKSALQFYTTQFGWTAGDVMPMGEMGDYQFIHHGSERIGAMMKRQEPGPPPMWNFYFRVADMNAAAKRTSAGGGTVLHGPMEVPGGDHIVIATDPQGALFSLVGRV